MTGWVGAASFVALLAVVALGAGWLQHEVLSEHRDTEVIRAPSPADIDGGLVTREQIAEFEATIERCEASGRECLVVIEGAPAGTFRPGWITPTAGK